MFKKFDDYLIQDKFSYKNDPIIHTGNLKDLDDILKMNKNFLYKDNIINSDQIFINSRNNKNFFQQNNFLRKDYDSKVFQKEIPGYIPQPPPQDHYKPPPPPPQDYYKPPVVPRPTEEEFTESPQKMIDWIALHEKSPHLQFRFESNTHITLVLLRKRYHATSLLIHPDKCKLPRAQEAIQILNNAYQQLLSTLTT